MLAAPSLRFNAAVQHLGISFPPFLLKHSPAGVPWMWMGSYSRSSSGHNRRLLQRLGLEHTRGSHHPINWKDTSVIDKARRPEELLLKEAIHIQGTPAGECLNRDGGKGIPRCWTAALKRSEGAAKWRPNHNFRRQITASGDSL